MNSHPHRDLAPTSAAGVLRSIGVADGRCFTIGLVIAADLRARPWAAILVSLAA